MAVALMREMHTVANAKVVSLEIDVKSILMNVREILAKIMGHAKMISTTTTVPVALGSLEVTAR